MNRRRITFVWYNGDLCQGFGEFSSTSVWCQDGAPDGGHRVLARAREGVFWIHGWHNDGDPALDAMRAALALVGGAHSYD